MPGMLPPAGAGGMTRDQRLVAAFAGLAVVAAGIVGADIAAVERPGVPVVSRDVPLGPDGRVTVRFVGDTMVGDALQPLIDQRGYDWPFDGVRADTTAADFVVAVAETPITDRVPVPGPPGPSLFATRPPAAQALARAGVDALSLATEHVLDTGVEGLADTTSHADAAGLATFGAGADLARAEQPLLLRTGLGTIGVVALTDATDDRARELVPGTTRLSPESVVRGRDLARAAGADWVVAVVDWGTNYDTVQPQQRYWAEVLATAGYDLVVGSGPHIAQPIEMVGSTPVAFSVGNFVYGTQGRFGPLGLPGFGLAVGLEIGPDRAPQVTIGCLTTDNRATGFQPRYCDAAQSAAFLPTLGAGVRVEGNRAALACPCFARREPS